MPPVTEQQIKDTIAAYVAEFPTDQASVDHGTVPFVLNLRLACLSPEDRANAQTIAQAREGDAKIDPTTGMWPGETYIPDDVKRQRLAVHATLVAFDARQAAAQQAAAQPVTEAHTAEQPTAAAPSEPPAAKEEPAPAAPAPAAAAPAQTPAAEAAAAPSGPVAPGSAVTHETLEQHIDEWFAKHFHTMAGIIDTTWYNHVRAAAEELKARLHALFR